MELHFLPGDAQVKEFRESGIGGETLVCRECLVEGDLSGADLWRVYKTGDRDTLRRLSAATSPAFPYLQEVCEAAIDKDSKPAEIVRQIQAGGAASFSEIFREFRRRAGVYGFGDSQVKAL